MRCAIFQWWRFSLYWRGLENTVILNVTIKKHQANDRYCKVSTQPYDKGKENPSRKYIKKAHGSRFEEDWHP